MQNITRRRAILGMGAAATAVPIIASSARAAAPENPAFVAASEKLSAIRADLKAAQEAVEWIVAEWRHLWPLAPEEILGGANVHLFAARPDTAERDIAGRYVMRETATLTKRLAPKFRREGVTTCFALDTAAELSERLARWQEHQPQGRTPQRLAREQRRHAKGIRQTEKKLALAREYEAETARIRMASNIAPALARVSGLRDAERRTLDDLIQIEPWTPRGLTLKATALLATDAINNRVYVGKCLARDVVNVLGAGA